MMPPAVSSTRARVPFCLDLFAERNASYKDFAPPKIDIMAEARTHEQEAALVKPAWEVDKASMAASQKFELHPARAAASWKAKPHFGKMENTAELSAAEIVKERKRKKKAAEEAEKLAQEEAEQTKFDHMCVPRARDNCGSASAGPARCCVGQANAGQCRVVCGVCGWCVAGKRK